MPNDFTRPPEGFRFQFLGMRTNDSPDSLAPGKYPIAINIRGYDSQSIVTRPGQSSRFTTTVQYPILDLHTYATLGTDNLPRILAYNKHSSVYLDTGTLVGSLGIPPFGVIGAAMIPFRPNASPAPWMYIANGADYQKFSSPSATNTVTQQKVGIAEPQHPPNAAIIEYGIGVIASGAPTWTPGGTANSPATGDRVNDTAGAVLQDPTPNSFTYSIQVSASIAYQKNMIVSVEGNGLLVQDVFQPLPTAISISAIYYFTGTTGRCIIVPANIASGPGSEDTSIYTQNLLASLRRGALIEFSGGSEVCYVWSVTTGPEGSISIETSTTGTHTTSETITALPAISVASGVPATGNTIIDEFSGYAVTVGIGTETTPVSSNPFNLGGANFQPDDYISFGIIVDNLLNLNEMKILLDVGDGSFTENFYYYTVRPSDITAGIGNTLTQLAASQIVTQRAIIDEEDAAAANNQLQTSSSAQSSPGDNQWSQIVFPVSELTRVGSDQTKSLQNINSVQMLWNANATINVATDFIFVFGGYQPDVGDAGAPYLYRVRPRSSLTGVVGNPSPATRYGVNPRRESVTVALPSAAYDSQIDTWDIFRYGGAITSWRQIGTTPSTNASFTDNYDDSSAEAGIALDFDNFEPWPTVDVPNLGTVTSLCGTTAIVSQSTPLINNILAYLPGTLVQIGGVDVYTLWARPISLGSNSYLLQFVENAGSGTALTYIIQEPFIANQHLPYMWGPDAEGTVFACGDPLRPGTLSFSKNYSPDSAPDTYNQEISPPSEPLMGGETLDGLSFAASTERWWALYPQPQNSSERYSVVQQPFTRGLVAPYGHCTDGKNIYWWAKDGIYSSGSGSLTDADLYNLFPHEGIAGKVITYNGTSVNPPVYSRAGQFRLEYANGFLYATYVDSSSVYHTLTLNTQTGAWNLDNYSPAVTVIHHPEQQAGTVQSVTTLYDEVLMGNTLGAVSAQSPLTNDLGGPIPVILATREFNGGDDRAPKQWGDFFVDLVPNAASGVLATPMSLGAPAATATLLPSGNSRLRLPVSVGGVVVSDFMGIQLNWTDNYSVQSAETKLRIWQPSFVIQPARTIAWATFGTSYGNDGYMHVRQLSLAYVSTAAITLTPVSYDGMSPNPVTIPSSGGKFVKILIQLSANKGQLYNWMAASTAPFQIFSEDTDIYVGAWGRTTPYAMPENFGGAIRAPSPI